MLMNTDTTEAVACLLAPSLVLLITTFILMYGGQLLLVRFFAGIDSREESRAGFLRI